MINILNIIYTVPPMTLNLAYYNFNLHQPVLIICGRNVAKRASYQTGIFNNVLLQIYERISQWKNFENRLRFDIDHHGCGVSFFVEHSV